MTRAKDISKIVTDADLSGTLDVTGTVTAGAINVAGASGAEITITDNSPSTVSLYMGAGNSSVSIGSTTSDPVTFLTANTERMRIDSSGNVGIATSSPVNFGAGTAGLTINGSASHITWQNSGTNVAFAYNVGNNFLIGSEQAGSSTIFTSAGSERMRIESSGNLLVGTTSQIGAGKTSIAFDRTSQWGLAINNTSSTAPNPATMIEFQYAGTSNGYIQSNGSSTSYNTSSDHRLKENVSYDFDATTRLKQLRPARFNFIADADTTVDGFLAHEVQSVVPEAISGTHNEVEVWQDGEELPDGVSVGDNKLDEDGNTIPVYQGIDQSKLVPLLVKTIQELEARIAALETA